VRTCSEPAWHTDEWLRAARRAQADPEDYVRSGDAEAAPDADAPRPCGLALLRTLLACGGEPVAQELVQLAARLQVPPARALAALPAGATGVLTDWRARCAASGACMGREVARRACLPCPLGRARGRCACTLLCMYAHRLACMIVTSVLSSARAVPPFAWSRAVVQGFGLQ